MKWSILKVLVLLIVTGVAGCIKQIDVQLRDAGPILVVEGGITTDTIPYTIKLTYSGPYDRANEIPEKYLEKNANIIIFDDQGRSTTLTYSGIQGIYQTTDASYVGEVGRSYSTKIVLPDGKVYISKPELINPPVDISTVHVSFNSDFDFFTPSSFRITADINDPSGEENYYKWDFQTYFLRKTHGVGCGFGCIMYEYCFQKHIDKDIRLLSDNAINGNIIADRLMGYSYIYTFGKHYADIAQSSITRGAYQFWKQYNEQQTRTGSTLDPLPASIKGNIYNESNPDDIALGYFSASSVTHKKFIIVPINITQYLLDISAQQFIPPGEKVCFEYFPDALAYPPPPEKQYPPPPGWENAEALEVRWQYP